MELTGENFDAALAENATVLVDFWATWCGPCQMLAPELEALCAAHPEIVLGKVNVDEQIALADRFRIEAIPAVYLFKNGEAVTNAIGYRTKEELEAVFGL